MIKNNLYLEYDWLFPAWTHRPFIMLESYWPQVYLSHRLISCLPVDHFRGGLLHILPGGGSIVWHTWHRGHWLHNRQRYTKGAPVNLPRHLQYFHNVQRFRALPVMQSGSTHAIFLLIIVIIFNYFIFFFRFHLNSNLRCSRKGPNHPGLCERERENSEDHCADGSVWCWASEPRTGVRREDSESEGLWGEKTTFCHSYIYLSMFSEISRTS